MTKVELEKEAEKLYEDWYAHKLGAISIIGVICKMAEPREKRIEELEAQIEKMNELINRYYEVCVQIPKEYRTMVFDSCLEDTRQLRR